ncbi:MAG: hypothetical protein GY847_07215 [Proteobacteria bacterium]|nr:hypothetical protein [Pseudomonadota bacterium]
MSIYSLFSSARPCPWSRRPARFREFDHALDDRQRDLYTILPVRLAPFFCAGLFEHRVNCADGVERGLDAGLDLGLDRLFGRVPQALGGGGHWLNSPHTRARAGLGVAATVVIQILRPSSQDPTRAGGGGPYSNTRPGARSWRPAAAAGVRILVGIQ